MVDFFTALENKDKKPHEILTKQEQPVTRSYTPTLFDRGPTASGKHNPNGVLSNGKVKIFVYGTLKRRNIRHHFLANATFLCEAYLGPEFKLKQTDAFPGILHPASGFPVALRKEEKDTSLQVIRGEIYESTYADLRKLDEIENAGVMFNKAIVSAYRFSEEDPKVKEMFRCYTYIGIDEYWDNVRLFDTPVSNIPVPHYIFNPFSTNQTRSVPDVG